jgi:hypothetical protein
MISTLPLPLDENITELNDSLTEIDSTEQLILQHLHTSGIKKNKEIFLLNEFSTLKKLRKQLFSKYSSKYQIIYSHTHQLQHELQNQQEQFLKFQKSISKKAQEKVEKLHVEYSERLREEKEFLTRKYSLALNELEKKIEMIASSQPPQQLQPPPPPPPEDANEIKMLKEEIQRRESQTESVTMR